MLQSCLDSGLINPGHKARDVEGPVNGKWLTTVLLGDIPHTYIYTREYRAVYNIYIYTHVYIYIYLYWY